VENGNPLSANNLGVIYLRGENVQRNLELAEKFYLYAINKQTNHAIIDLVDLYLKKVFPEKARLWHQKAIYKNCLISISRDKEIKRQISEIQAHFVVI